MRGAVANDAPVPLVVRAFEYPDGYTGNFHRHNLGQLVYPVRGAVTVTSDQGQIVVANFRAAVIQPWMPHRVSAEGNASLRSLFIAPGFLDASFYEQPIRLITPLLHELIQEAGRKFEDMSEGSIQAKVLELIATLLPLSHAEQGFVILPTVDHPRLARVFNNIDAFDEVGAISTAAVADRAALSVRQFSRLFKQSTGMTYREWRTLYRIQKAIGLLSEGRSVTHVASELDFSTSSAFIDTFRKRTGLTPRKFLQNEN